MAPSLTRHRTQRAALLPGSLSGSCQAARVVDREPFVVVFSAHQAAAALWDYGEDDLVDRALALDEDELRQTWVLAARLWAPDRLPEDHRRVTLGRISAYAVVAHLEGEVRPLARTRRRPQKDRPPALADPRPVPPSTRI